MDWKRLNKRQREKIVLSFFDNPEKELTAAEIVELLKQRGITPPSRHQLAFWLRNNMKYKYLECRRKNKDDPRRYWRRRWT